MIYSSDNKYLFHIPILEKCKVAKCGKYRLILRHNATKEVFVFRINDIGNNKIRICFNFEFPEFMCFGEYDYYLVSDDNWFPEDINMYDVRNTVKSTDKEAVTANDMYIVHDEKLILTKWFKAYIYDDGKPIVKGDKCIVGDGESDNSEEYGNLYNELDILSSGVLYFKEYEPFCCSPFTTYDDNRKPDKMYKG